MEVVKLSTLSREQVRFPVFADSNGAPVDLSAYTVAVALKGGDSLDAAPSAPDWKAATWEVTVTGNYVAALEVGPSSTVGTLAPGRWRCWVRITAPNPGTDVVVRQAGQLVVY